jgi:hypothetical protein
MFVPRTQRFIWIWLVIAAVFVGRWDGAHLHLCFDGNEPAAAVHMADGAMHDDADHLETVHVDQDVELFGATLLKKVSGGLDLPLGVSTAILFLLPVVEDRAYRPAPVTPPILRRFAHLDPPPRGPPV